jgi:hypothetical protein
MSKVSARTLMRHRRQKKTPTPWIIEPDPMVPQPTAMGRAVRRLWIEEQLRLIKSGRRRRGHGARPEDD